MSKKKIIKNVLFTVAWLVIGSGMLTLLIAANNKAQERKCRKVFIALNGGEKYYIDKTDVQKILDGKLNGSLINKPLTQFNLAALEKALKKHPWVGKAELFFDNQDALHVLVTEKEPVLRIFTKDGNTFYLDSAGTKMPLLEKISIRLPVVTNFPDFHKPSSKDSILLGGLKNLISYINAHEFWKAQVAQIDIADDNNLELIPTVGNHIIRFGTVADIDSKFKRLFVFYQQVLSKTGFDKYRIVNVQYEGQVVGVKREAVAKIDSIQLAKNIELLMNETKLLEADQQQPEVLNTPVNGYGPQGLSTIDSIQATTVINPNPSKKDPIPVKPSPTVGAAKPKPLSGPKLKKLFKSNTPEIRTKAKPKAVMPGHNEY